MHMGQSVLKAAGVQPFAGRASHPFNDHAARLHVREAVQLLKVGNPTFHHQLHRNRFLCGYEQHPHQVPVSHGKTQNPTSIGVV